MTSVSSIERAIERVRASAYFEGDASIDALRGDVLDELSRRVDEFHAAAKSALVRGMPLGAEPPRIVRSVAEIAALIDSEQGPQRVASALSARVEAARAALRQALSASEREALDDALAEAAKHSLSRSPRWSARFSEAIAPAVVAEVSLALLDDDGPPFAALLRIWKMGVWPVLVRDGLLAIFVPTLGANDDESAALRALRRRPRTRRDVGLDAYTRPLEMPGVTLRFVTRDGASVGTLLATTQTTFGHANSNDLFINNRAISLVHGVIDYDGERWAITANAKSSGMRFNDAQAIGDKAYEFGAADRVQPGNSLTLERDPDGTIRSGLLGAIPRGNAKPWLHPRERPQPPRAQITDEALFSAYTLPQSSEASLRDAERAIIAMRWLAPYAALRALRSERIERIEALLREHFSLLRGAGAFAPQPVVRLRIERSLVRAMSTYSCAWREATEAPCDPSRARWLFAAEQYPLHESTSYVNESTLGLAVDQRSPHWSRDVVPLFAALSMHNVSPFAHIAQWHLKHVALHGAEPSPIAPLLELCAMGVWAITLPDDEVLIYVPVFDGDGLVPNPGNDPLPTFEAPRFSDRSFPYLLLSHWISPRIPEHWHPPAPKHRPVDPSARSPRALLLSPDGAAEELGAYNNLSLDDGEGSRALATIVARDGVHHYEKPSSEAPWISIYGHVHRFRPLLDGDALLCGRRRWIYRLL